jgi:hypothetical protein
MSVILALERLREEDYELEACLGCVVSSRPGWVTQLHLVLTKKNKTYKTKSTYKHAEFWFGISLRSRVP